MFTLSEGLKLQRHSNAVAAGTSVITPAAGVDMKGFESLLFVVPFGAITAGGVQSIEVHQSEDDGVADAYSALADTKVTVADDDDNKLAFLEVIRPGKRYLKCIVNRATQASAIDGIIAVLGNPVEAPVTHDAATVAGGEAHHAPEEGAA